jgi:predicted ATPase
MIAKILVKALKRFADMPFKLEPLTVLAGLNGTGKTTLIHALLLTREAENVQGGTVALNGPFGLELGTAGGVTNRGADDLTPRVELTDDAGTLHSWQFYAKDEPDLHLTVRERPKAPPFSHRDKPHAFTYLCAERLGPRSVLSSDAVPPERLQVGVRGEFTAQVIAAFGNATLPNHNRSHPTTLPEDAPLLKYVAERWLADIARPIELDAEILPGTLVTAMRFRAPGGDWVRAPNMGFGVTYALPVVVGGLLAANGGLFIVENPEAHLHPKGQSWMGIFLARLAGTGVQVIIETHSDHILNGIRLAIGQHRLLRADQALVQFFGSDDTAPSAQELRFTDSGGVSSWPPGFFDQFQIDVAALTRVRRPRPS